jgi:hypothetical protein
MIDTKAKLILIIAKAGNVHLQRKGRNAYLTISTVLFS